ncbi:hypothetical protein GCK32_006181 [Trichostrongylus colubriformis]|uniref:NB-ARC domain-containing protein n=1 Tax=Trichostrongylus colubriformis TaxID=6319 RepID=A0AAN8IL59_TRICO
MLSEPECRVLSLAFDVLAKDFDPKDAVIFLESSGLLTADLAERIESRPTRLERLRELLRIYRRRATDCDVLISYFEFAGQEHLAHLLRTDLEHVLDSCAPPKKVFPHHVRLRKLLAGGVPRVWQHVKRVRLQNEVAKLLKERGDLDSFIIVLHGIAGCGKSSLAAAVIADAPDLLGCCFESVIWLQDSRTDADRVHMLFADFLLMLWDDTSSIPPKLDDVSSVYLCKQIQEALIDNPNVLVILDDIVQEETVKWIDRLGIQSAIDAAFAVSSGNAALLSMLRKAASGRANRLATFSHRLHERGLSSLSLKSSYEYDSMHAALSISVERLSSDESDTLACAAILPSEEDIPLVVWALFVPVDVVDADEAEFLMLLSDRLTKICRNGGWLSHNMQKDTFRISKMVEIYLREALDSRTIKWNRIYGAYLSRKHRALFNEWNILETYQPRALTMGHLFEPEPPTPFPGEENSTPQQEHFKALRDAHYANEFTYAEKLAAEAKAMESSSHSDRAKKPAQVSSL